MLFTLLKMLYTQILHYLSKLDSIFLPKQIGPFYIVNQPANSGSEQLLHVPYCGMESMVAEIYIHILKCNLLGEKDGLYMLVLLASPRWR